MTVARKRYKRHPYIHGEELLAALGVDSEAEAWCRVWMLRLPFWATRRESALCFRWRQLDHALKREARGEVPFCCIACCPAFQWCERMPRRMLDTLREQKKMPSGADGDGGPRTAGTERIDPMGSPHLTTGRKIHKTFLRHAGSMMHELAGRDLSARP